MMHFLLLGAGGQLGGEWRDALDREGLSYTAYSSSELDITDAGRVEEAVEREQPGIILNCAAYTHVDRAEEEKDRALLVNATAVKFLALLCRKNGIKLVHYSTDYVFPGKVEDRRLRPGGYPEEAETGPVNWYGETKLRGEQAVREFTDDFLIIRTAWLCGRYGANFVKTMLQLGEERDSVSVVHDQWGSPSFAENVVANSYNLIRQGGRGVYHVTSGGLITWYDFAREIFNTAGIEIDVKAVPSAEFPVRAKRPFFSKLNTEKLREVPGSEIIGWKEGLKQLIMEIENRF